MNEIIYKNIFRDILEISDKALQQEIWLGNNPNRCSSFVEVMCRLFDDNDFTLFVNSIANEIGFSHKTLQELMKLHSELENYKELESDKKIIEDTKWEKITQIASNVINFWKQDELELQLKYKI